jgi:hypothetical protein
MLRASFFLDGWETPYHCPSQLLRALSLTATPTDQEEYHILVDKAEHEIPRHQDWNAPKMPQQSADRRHDLVQPLATNDNDY